MLKTIILLITFAIISSSSKVLAEEFTTVREARPNNISAGLDILVATLSPFSGVPLLSLEYNRNLNKNYSVGLNVKTVVIANYINASGRYYSDLLDSKSYSLYIQGDLGYSAVSYPVAPGGGLPSTTSFINLNPTIGYEFRAENGFTFNADIGPYLTYSLGVVPNNISRLSIAPVKLGAKFGYSF